MIDEANRANKHCQPPGLKPGGSQDPYPWLDPDDPRHKLTDEQILERTVDLSTSCLTNRENCGLMRMIKRYKRAFSLRNEIGECPNIQLNMSHFTYACKMQCPLNLVLENSEYLWFY